MLQDELRTIRPSTKLQDDNKQVHFLLGSHHIQYYFVVLLDLLVCVMSKHLSHTVA